MPKEPQPKTVKFGPFTAQIDYREYENGRLAISLVDDEGLVATATVNIPEVRLGSREVLIKDWSENAGMLAALIKAGIVRDTGRRISSEFVVAPVVEVIDPDAPVNRRGLMDSLAKPAAGPERVH